VSIERNGLALAATEQLDRSTSTACNEGSNKITDLAQPSGAFSWVWHRLQSADPSVLPANSTTGMFTYVQITASHTDTLQNVHCQITDV